MPDITAISGVPQANITKRTGKARANIARFSSKAGGANLKFPLAAPVSLYSSTLFQFESQTRNTSTGNWSPSGTAADWVNGTSAVNGTYWGRTSNKTVKGWNCDDDGTGSGGTGPAGGVVIPGGTHSTADASDMYLYTETSSGRNAYAFVARMPGVNFSTSMGNTSNNLNLTFWVHAYGSNMGDLYVYIDDSTTSNHTNATELLSLESFTGFTANSSVWQEQTVSLNSYRSINSTHYIYFVSQNGTGFRADMAIDGIQISESE